MHPSPLRGSGLFLGIPALLFATAALGCGAAPPQPGGAAAASSPRDGAPSGSCRRTSALEMRPLGEARAGGTVALAVVAGRTVAFAADEDSRAVQAVDVEARTELAATPLPGAPSQLVVLPDGRLVVALRDRAALAVLEPGAKVEAPLSTLCTVPTAAEPIALTVTPDGATLLATSGWGRALGAYQTDTFERRFQVALPREPRAVVVSDDGATAFVAHAVGSKMSLVDLRKGDHPVRAIRLMSKQPVFGFPSLVSPSQGVAVETEEEAEQDERKPFERATCQGYALAKSVDPPGRILVPEVMVDPGDPERRPGGYGDENIATELPNIAVIDESTRAPLGASLEVAQDFVWLEAARDKVRAQECLLPRAAAVDSESRTLLVACLGLDAVVAYDAAAPNPARIEKRRWGVGAGPTGVAVDAAKRRAVVWSQFERTLSVLALSELDALSEDPAAPRPVAIVALAPPARPVPHDVALGRELFHAVGDSRISLDGRACASCHPDGRDDALVWATPDGPRRTLMLAGRIQGTAPYAWSGSGKDLKEHLDHTFDRLSGQGLRGMELQALAAYVSTLAPPPAAAGAGDPRVAQGERIFHSKEAKCATCHGGAAFSDGRAHDIKSGASADRSAEFDTPSLRFLSGRAPYFHDGRYKTLRDLLVRTDGAMGHTKHLSNDELSALEAYLRSL